MLHMSDMFVYTESRNKKLEVAVDNRQYCTPNELASKLLVSTQTIRRWIDEGRIEGAEQIGKQWRIPIEYCTGERKIKPIEKKEPLE